VEEVQAAHNLHGEREPPPEREQLPVAAEPLPQGAAHHVVADEDGALVPARGLGAGADERQDVPVAAARHGLDLPQKLRLGHVAVAPQELGAPAEPPLVHGVEEAVVGDEVGLAEVARGLRARRMSASLLLPRQTARGGAGWFAGEMGWGAGGHLSQL
jgi:hypothetical protein